MATDILVENGPWRSVSEVIAFKGQRNNNVHKAVERANFHCKKSLGLRQPPIELREDNSGGYEIRARGVSGTFSTNSFSVNIAPKFVPQANIEESWGGDLISFVRYSQKKDHIFTQSFNLEKSGSSLIDLLGMAFLDAVKDALKDQLIHTYKTRELQLPNIRGRLNIHRQVQSVYKTPHLFQCDVDQMNTENEFNSLIKWAALILSKSVKSANLKRELIEISYKIPGRPNNQLAKREVNIITPPQYRSWKPALEICSMLQKSISLNAGNDVRHGYSILFNLEKIFEQCIERLLKKSVNLMKMNGLQCKPQASIEYAKPIFGSNRSFYSKPDNLVYGARGSVALVDAKYKLLSDKEGFGNRKPQNPDAYELVAGMTAHACNVGLLVYPKVYSTVPLNDDQLKVWEVNSFGQKFKIGSLALDLIMLKDKAGRDKLSATIADVLDQLISI